MNQKRTSVRINSRKFDGSIHRSWKADLIERKDSLLVLLGEFEQEVIHPNLGVIRRGTLSYEYYWLDRCFNVFRFHEPEGELRLFYCNLNQLPKFENDTLDYIDLDIDVLVHNDFSFEILDLEEFKENAVKFNYPTDLKLKTQTTLDELLHMIKMKEFPFDYE